MSSTTSPTPIPITGSRSVALVCTGSHRMNTVRGVLEAHDFDPVCLDHPPLQQRRGARRPIRARLSDTSPALEAIEAAGVPHRVVRIEPAPDLATAAARRGVPVSRLLKTMVVRVAEGSHVLVLVPGDRVIDWAALRAHLGVRRLSLADADDAFAATGYRRGTITPLGARGNLRVVADSAIPGSGEVSIGAGVLGGAVHLDADDLIRVTTAEVAAVTKLASE